MYMCKSYNYTRATTALKLSEQMHHRHTTTMALRHFVDYNIQGVFAIRIKPQRFQGVLLLQFNFSDWEGASAIRLD